MRHRYNAEEIYVFVCIAGIWVGFILLLACLK
jgi:hypothetical protein